MSFSAENINAEVELCYKALGLSFSDSPERIEKVYRSIREKFSREMHSSDLEVRQNASKELQQLDELYRSITESLVYKDYAREYEKQREIRINTKQEKQQKKQAEKKIMITCRFCNKVFQRSFKTCPYCNKKPPLSLGAKITIALTIVAAIAAVGVVFVLLVTRGS